MKKLTKIQQVEQYDLKNPNATARQAGADLDMSPNQVYQIRWNLRNRKAKKVKEPVRPLNPKQLESVTNLLDSWEKGIAPEGYKFEEPPVKTGFGAPPVKTEGTKIPYDITDTLAGAVLKRKLELLETKIAEQAIIIKYLEQRVYEEKADGS